jgi:hypothetical protein
MDWRKKNDSFFGISNRVMTEPMMIALAEDGHSYMHKLRDTPQSCMDSVSDNSQHT